jgi:uncharacterized protein YjgD (DUF1641 family)
MSHEEELLIGEPVFGKSGGKSFNNFRIEDGSNTYRILPPLMSLAKEGRWYQYWRIHFGFKNSEGRTKVIVCVEEKDYKTKVIKQKCPVCELVARNKAQYEKLKLINQKDPTKVTDEQLKNFYKNNVFAIDASGKYYVNAVNSQGEVGVLALPKTVKDKIEVLAERLKKEEGINPIAVNGLFLNIIRTGQGRNTDYSVEVAYVSDPNNPRSKMYKEHTITADVVEKIKRNASDLSTLYKPITVEQIEMIVNASPENRAAIVDKIFSKPEKKQNSDLNDRVSLGNTGASGVINVGVDRNGNLKVNVPEQPKEQTLSAEEQEALDALSMAETEGYSSSSNLGLDVGQKYSDFDFENMSEDEFERMMNS